MWTTRDEISFYIKTSISISNIGYDKRVQFGYSFSNRHLYLSSGVKVSVDLRTDRKRHLCKRYRTKCSKYVEPFSRVIIVEGNLYDRLMRKRIFTVIMNKIFI